MVLILFCTSPPAAEQNHTIFTALTIGATDDFHLCRQPESIETCSYGTSSGGWIESPLTSMLIVLNVIPLCTMYTPTRSQLIGFVQLFLYSLHSDNRIWYEGVELGTLFPSYAECFYQNWCYSGLTEQCCGNAPWEGSDVRFVIP